MMRRFNSTLTSVNSGIEAVIICEKSDVFPFADGKRTSDTPIGTRLVVALPGARLEHLSVRFDTDPIPKITDEQIQASVENCQFIYATLPDCVVTLYPSANGIGMTATGKTVQLVTFEK